MRTPLIIAPLLLLCGSPALTQAAPAAEADGIQLPRELTDPASQRRLVRSAEALTQAVMNMKVGDVSAPRQGREPTARERNLTVGDLARRKDPNLDRDIQRKIASVEPKLRQSVAAVNQALPQIMHGVVQAEQAIDRLAANMPDPNYPVR